MFIFEYLYFCEKLKIMRIDIITVLPEMIEGFQLFDNETSSK